MKKTYLSKHAPKPIGPYSQAIKTGNLLFISGQIGLDPTTMQMVAEDCRSQAEQIFKNIAAILKKAKCDFDSIIKLTIFLTDLNHFAVVNELMRELFKEPFPARSTIEVSKLPKDALIEIEAIAICHHD